MSTATLIFILCAGCTLMLSFLFVTNIPRQNRKANRWLSAFYFCLACVFSQLAIYQEGTLAHMGDLVRLLELATWATLPCFYLAVLTFTRPKLSVFSSLMHFVPAVAFALSTLFFAQPPILPSWLSLLIRYFFSGQMIVYWVLSYVEFLRYQKYLLSVASTIQDIDLTWLRDLLWAALGMIGIRFLIPDIMPFTYLAAIMFLAYHSVRQQHSYPVPLILTVEEKVWERFEAEQVAVLQKEVVLITTRERLYLDPTLTLPALARSVGVNVQDLSYVLNNGLKKTFYQFINELRVEEAKVLLRSDKVKTLDMIGIAAHSGFNSKTTFYTTFKKLTGQTPAQFQKTVQLDTAELSRTA